MESDKEITIGASLILIITFILLYLIIHFGYWACFEVTEKTFVEFCIDGIVSFKESVLYIFSRII